MQTTVEIDLAQHLPSDSDGRGIMRKPAGLPQTSGRGAFTLIELLVVIAIIAILAAILFPVFASAREKARQTTCASNEKQLGLAVLQYVQDFDECFPDGQFAQSGNNYYSTGFGWAGDVYPYMKSLGIFTCPDDPTLPDKSGSGIPETIISYAYNNDFDMSNAYGNQGPVGVINVSKLSAPVLTVMFSEVSGFGNTITAAILNQPGWNGRDYSPADNGELIGGYGGETSDNPVYRLGTNIDPYYPYHPVTTYQPAFHGGGDMSNILYADGHVKGVLAQNICPGWWAATATSQAQGPIHGGDNYDYQACGTGNMKTDAGSVAYATFSPR
jgi:prepilin-type N-terminal cleavage/methylation domain-containing protein/prepilin-type processing-associated H-X9-DG protein